MYQYRLAAILLTPVLLISGEPLIKNIGAGRLAILLFIGFGKVDVSVGAILLPPRSPSRSCWVSC
jgi:hypothetical protein